VSGVGRIILFGASLAAVGAAGAHAQAVLGDPKDAPKIFAANCSACHKSPRGLAKSGSVAGFLRQHYTTGPEMSAAMAAYLVSAGSAPEPKKGPAAADAMAAKSKSSKKGEQLAAQHPQGEAGEAIQQHTLRGKQRQAKAHEDAAAATHATAAPQPPAPAAEPAAEEKKQTAAATTAVPTPSAAEPPVVLNVPMPDLPEGPPSDLVQSLFSSSPVP